MSDDEAQQDAEPEVVDVKAKMAQLSGNRIRQERDEKRAAAAGRIPKSKPNPEPKPEPPPEYVPEHSPEDLAAVAPAPKPATPEPKRKDKKKRPAVANLGVDEAPGVGPIATFVAGFVAGVSPGVVSLGMGLVQPKVSPEGIPPDAIQRVYDWVHCTDSSASRWQCDVYGGNGRVSQSGEFVPSVDPPKEAGDWRSLAMGGALVEDGWHDPQGAGPRILYVRGVKLVSMRKGAK